MKADVEMQLPPKKEYVLYTPLTEKQRELYEVAMQGDKALRTYLITQMKQETERLNGGGDADSEEEEKPLQEVALEKTKSKGKGLRAKGQKKVYIDDSDDEDYFEKLAEAEELAKQERERNDRQLGREWQRRAVGECLIKWGSRSQLTGRHGLQ